MNIKEALEKALAANPSQIVVAYEADGKVISHFSTKNARELLYILRVLTFSIHESVNRHAAPKSRIMQADATELAADIASYILDQNKTKGV